MIGQVFLKCLELLPTRGPWGGREAGLTLCVSTVTTMAVVPGYGPITILLIANLLLVR